MRWRVTVFGGVTPDDALLQQAPIEIDNARTHYVGADGPIGPAFHLPVYVGVVLQTRSVGSLSMVADGIPESLHVMDNVWHVYFESGGLEIEGVERRDDGAMIHSRWECAPSGPTSQDKAVLTWLDEQS